MSSLQSVLVVGGRGSLGKAIVRHLQSIQVPSIRTYDSAPLNVKEEQIGQSHILHLQGDVRDHDAAKNAVKGIQTVIWAVMPNLFSAVVKVYHQVNVEGLKNFVQATEESALTDKFVYTSSCAVTNILRNSFDEDEHTPLPDHAEYKVVYDLTKRLGEDFALEANKRGKILTCSLRPAAILSEDPSSPLAKFLVEPKVGFVSHAEVPYDYIGTRDLSRALVMSAEKMTGNDTDKVSGNPFFTTGHKTSSKAINHMVFKKMNKKVYTIPRIAEDAVRAGSALHHRIIQSIAPEKVKGYPLHYLIDTPRLQKTFKNHRAGEWIGFTPDYSVEEMTDHLVQNAKALGF